MATKEKDTVKTADNNKAEEKKLQNKAEDKKAEEKKTESAEDAEEVNAHDDSRKLMVLTFRRRSYLA